MIAIGMKNQAYASSQQQIRDENIMLLFNQIRKAPVSRAALAEIASLSPTTVSTLVEDLIRGGWVVETGPDVTFLRGRRPVILTVNASRGYVATVELLSRGYICTLYDICLNKISGTRIHNTEYDGASVAATIYELLKSKRIPKSQLLGTHTIFPGMIDSASGTLRFSAVIPRESMPESTFLQTLNKSFGSSHNVLSNNGSIIAYTEFISEKKQSSLPLLSVNIDEGIIGGVVMSDEQSGVRMCFPVEIGHIIVDHNGPQCKCGNAGCLEALCSTPSLFRMMNERAGMSLTYMDTFGADCNVAAMEEVAVRLRAYDSAAMTVLADYVQILCSGLVSVVNLLNIQSIRIGGDIALLNDALLNVMRSTLRDRFRPLNNNCEVEVELFTSDYEDIRRAAAIQCMDELFHK